MVKDTHLHAQSHKRSEVVGESADDWLGDEFPDLDSEFGDSYLGDRGFGEREPLASDSQSGDLNECRIHCPYCGEPIVVMVDPTETESSYVEDCSVCCRPMTLQLETQDDGRIGVQPYSADDIV